jgi:hypothetical protein
MLDICKEKEKIKVIKISTLLQFTSDFGAKKGDWCGWGSMSQKESGKKLGQKGNEEADYSGFGLSF